MDSRDRYELYSYLTILAGLLITGFIPRWMRRVMDPLVFILILFGLYLAYKSFWRGGIILLIIGSLTGLIFEVIGVNIGIPFGNYEYVELKHISVLEVPIPVIMAWGLYIVITYMYVKTLIRNNGLPISLLVAIYMVILDLALDPVMVKAGLWRWIDVYGATWYGIPLTNYIGWFTVSFVSIIFYSIVTRNRKYILYAGKHQYLAILCYLSLYLPIINTGFNLGVYDPILVSISLFLLISILLSIYQQNKYKSQLFYSKT